MKNLLPCPFCGGEARTWKYSHPQTGDYWRVACNSNRLDCCISGRADSEAEAIDAWNTRAERTCFADEVTHRDCKYSVNRGWRERTCHIEYPYYGDAPVINGQPRCSECKTEFAVGTFPNYCPNCGAKVVEQ